MDNEREKLLKSLIEDLEAKSDEEFLAELIEAGVVFESIKEDKDYDQM